MRYHGKKFTNVDMSIRVAEITDKTDSEIYQEIQDLFKHTSAKAIYLTECRKLFGVVSRGDFLRIDNATRFKHENFFQVASIEIGKPDHQGLLAKHNSIPIISKDGDLLKVLEVSEIDGIEIANSYFEKYRNVLTIAEIGNNHNGSLERCIELIHSAHQSGAKAIKLQFRSLDDLYISTSEEFLKETDYGTAYTVRQLKKFNLSDQDMFHALSEIKKVGCLAICTPFDVASAHKLIDFEIDAFKIASADMSNRELLSAISLSNKPIIISTGMHTIDEIKRTSEFLKKQYCEFTFLHTNSTYPTPYDDINLSFLTTLSEYSSNNQVGYSGHERGFHVCLAAVALGSCIIEKHFTFDKSDVGNDHKVSLLPEEFTIMTSQVQDLQASLSSSGAEKVISQGERLNKIALSKSAYLVKSLQAGDVLRETDIVYKSPCVGLTPSEVHKFLGLAIGRNLEVGTPLTPSLFQADDVNHMIPTLGRVGLPVRLRDIDRIYEQLSPHFVEYHMFATDLEIDPSEFSDKFQNRELAIHAPEQFDDGFVLDLVAMDDDIVARSRSLLLDILNWARKVGDITQQDNISLITNVGGAYQKRGDFELINQNRQYDLLAEAIDIAHRENVELLPQTMPPFPWHFGGQGFHSLFVDLNQVLEFQKIRPSNFCLDLSHSLMSCAHLGRNFYEEIERVKNYVSYLHVADALPPSEEGIQLGDGLLDFNRAMQCLSVEQRDLRWIPEIWNGHFNDFEGFKFALNKVKELTR